MGYWQTGDASGQKCVLTFTVDAIGAQEDDIIVGIVDQDDLRDPGAELGAFGADVGDPGGHLFQQDTLEPTVTSNFVSVYNEGRSDEGHSYLLWDTGLCEGGLQPQVEIDSTIEIIVDADEEQGPDAQQYVDEEHCKIEFRIDGKPLYDEERVIPPHVGQKDWVPLVSLTHRDTILRLHGWRVANATDDARWMRGLEVARAEQAALAEAFAARHGTHNSLRL